MLGEASTKLLGAGRIAVGLEDARAGGEPSQQAQALALHLTSWVGLVTKVGVLGLGIDRILRDSDAERAEGGLSDLLGELIETIPHQRRQSATRMWIAATSAIRIHHTRLCWVIGS
ncbi:MAG TPA: hypothetical protein VF516_35315 [Kofleriaceae bacterium]